MPNPALPPGARWAPIQSLRYMRDAYGYTERMRRRHGDPFTMPSMNGTLDRPRWADTGGETRTRETRRTVGVRVRIDASTPPPGRDYTQMPLGFASQEVTLVTTQINIRIGHL